MPVHIKPFQFVYVHAGGMPFYFFTVRVCVCVCVCVHCVCVFVCALVSSFREVTWPSPPLAGLFLNIPCAEGSLQGLSLHARVSLSLSLSLRCRSICLALSPLSLFFISLAAYNLRALRLPNHNWWTDRCYQCNCQQHWRKSMCDVCLCNRTTEEQPLSLSVAFHLSFVFGTVYSPRAVLHA